MCHNGHFNEFDDARIASSVLSWQSVVFVVIVALPVFSIGIIA